MLHTENAQIGLTAEERDLFGVNTLKGLELLVWLLNLRIVGQYCVKYMVRDFKRDVQSLVAP